MTNRTHPLDADLAAAIEERREVLRMSGLLTEQQIEAQARADAILALRDREIGERGAQRHARKVSRAGAAARSHGLTWAKVRPAWERHYASSRSTKRADSLAAADQKCSVSAIQKLRLAAGKKTKKQRR